MTTIHTSIFNEFFYKSAVLAEELEKSLQREEKFLRLCNELSDRDKKSIQLNHRSVANALNHWTSLAKCLNSDSI